MRVIVWLRMKRKQKPTAKNDFAQIQNILVLVIRTQAPLPPLGCSGGRRHGRVQHVEGESGRRQKRKQRPVGEEGGRTPTAVSTAAAATAAATLPGIAGEGADHVVEHATAVGLAVVAAVAGVHLAVGPGLQGQVVSTNAGRKIQRSILFKVIWFRGYTGV